MVSDSRNIVLVGFMGTGKTTVGKLLAEDMGRVFVDLDDAIVEQAGISIPELFESRGEEGFREVERAVVVAEAAGSGKVISCGGGIVKNPENIELLAERGELVCLTAKPETILERVGSDSNRPLLAGENRLARIRALLDERAPLYAQIKRHVATDGRSPAQIATAVQKVIER